ncbi:MAG TPA: hypothetical protein VG144_02985, partial [Gaiellaceae bacterium]|nr:hypothetical protein [Gaiellaceae bacterium]
EASTEPHDHSDDVRQNEELVARHGAFLAVRAGACNIDTQRAHSVQEGRRFESYEAIRTA